MRPWVDADNPAWGHKMSILTHAIVLQCWRDLRNFERCVQEREKIWKFQPHADLKPEICDNGSMSEFLRVISCYCLFRISKTTMIPLISCFNPQFKSMTFPHNVRRAVEVYWSLLIRLFHKFWLEILHQVPICNGIATVSELSIFRTAMARATCKSSHKWLILLRTNQSLVINRPNLFNTIWRDLCSKFTSGPGVVDLWYLYLVKQLQTVIIREQLNLITQLYGVDATLEQCWKYTSISPI